MPSLARELIDQLAALTDDSLLSATGLEAIRAVEELLAPSTGGIAIEAHLGQPAPRSDLIVRVLQADCGDLLRCTAARLAPARRFAESWARAPGLELVPYVDLEFDLDGSGRECFVGAMIEPNLHRGMARVPRSRGEAWFEPVSSFAVASAFLRAAEVSPVGEELLREMCMAFDALPHGGVIGHLGSLRCRQSGGEDLVRLIVSLPHGDLEAYLRAIGWPGDVVLLKAAMGRHKGARAKRVDIDLNVTARGLSAETGFYTSMWNPYDDDVAGAVRRLVADGLATGAQGMALVRFASGTAAALRGIPWTMTFKIKVDGAGKLLAKVYLSLLPTG